MSLPVPQRRRSVLPRVTWHPTPHGSALVSAPQFDPRPSVVMLGVGIVFIVLSVLALVVGIAATATLGLVEGLWQLGASGTAGLVLGGSLTFAGSRRLWLNSTLRDGELLVPRLPLRLGETVLIRYSQRRSTRANVADITATLVLRERARTATGKGSYLTDTHTVWTAELETARPDDPIGDSARLRGTWRMRVPDDQEPSFAGISNHVEWVVIVRAETTRGRDIETEFLVPVVPEILTTPELR
ncbi:MAG: hypothetical protein Q4F67_00120 [Propionibacteriaceae bacterium]|nr:hypothetical protein [Propionibacteriaceae bacterium]